MEKEHASFLCPICRAPLALLPQGKGVWRCPKGHSFDVAGSGYVNLLPSSRGSAHLPGDNPEMMRARRDFLALGFYEPLLGLLSQAVSSRCPADPVLIDAGCGEGYYTSGLASALRAQGQSPTVYGFDLSKTGVQYAAKRDKSLRCAVASVYNLPLPEACAHAVLSLFAPVAGQEFWRVLRPGGWLLVAAPSPRHLFGLKQALYDNPYENAVKRREYDGFTLLDTLEINYTVTLPTNKAILDLFWMTPYVYNSYQGAQKRLEGLEQLETPLGFLVYCYQKTSPSAPATPHFPA